MLLISLSLLLLGSHYLHIGLPLYITVPSRTTGQGAQGGEPIGMLLSAQGLSLCNVLDILNACD